MPPPRKPIIFSEDQNPIDQITPKVVEIWSYKNPQKNQIYKNNINTTPYPSNTYMLKNSKKKNKIKLSTNQVLF